MRKSGATSSATEQSKETDIVPLAKQFWQLKFQMMPYMLLEGVRINSKGLVI